MTMIARFEKIRERDRRYASRYMLVFSGGVFIHALLAVVFLIYGHPVFGALNGLSILMYLGWFALFTRIPVNSAMLLVLYLDNVIHVCLYNVFFGAGCAFYLHAFTIITISFFLSSKDLKDSHPVIISVALSVIVSVLALVTAGQPPKYSVVGTAEGNQYFQLNLLVCGLLLSAYLSEFMLESRTTQQDLTFHAENDSLTGLRNRYGFSKVAENLLGTQYCVIMCDIDDFKRINDVYGHQVGDMVLARIGKLFQTGLRREDVVCRWGGEEFVMLIRSDLDTARRVAERLRRKVAAATVDSGTDAVQVTMTFGIADCLEGDSFDDLVRIADANLLRGKRSGKDCVILSSEAEGTLRQETDPKEELDVAFLDSRIFNAFAATSDTTYLYICNLSTNVSRWSKSAVEYFGLPGEYMYDAGNIWLGFVHPDDREAYSEDINAVFSGKKQNHDMTYRARNRNGDYVVCTCKGVITEGDANAPALFAGTMTNMGPAEAAPRKGRR